MTYGEVKRIFQELKRTSPRNDLTVHITFTEDSFSKVYPLLSRTYRVSSDNKAYWPNMGGYSNFGYCLDGTDQGIRLDWYMAEEGNPEGWQVEDCYILERMRDASAISSLTRAEQEDGTVCYFFADTCIRVHELHAQGQIHLQPVSGDQTACGEWVELPIDRIHGYFTLLYRNLNNKYV